MGTSFDPGLLSALKTWEGLSEIASADDPFKRVVAVVFGTPLVEGRLSELGIMGWGHGQVSSLHKAVRRAEKRFLLEPTVVAAGLRAIKDRNKVAHHDPGVRLLDDAASDAEEDEEEDEDEDGEEDGEEESSDSIEAILERAPQVVEQLWALDAEIEKGAAEEDARRSAEVGARRRKEKEIERLIL